ncbi:MAG: bifunctional 4-hydroxy-2-oxoglutarate aldolase/2-dehydro-3-deoxy-phosphogluconate aldolase [Anaerolineaceae bacterium]|nr:bifunctional 4-hydroxy-2-oxoglutarate aldolase/2-dehydro-3-deoxy-phosphogluconate aldolase [Anaerolineaceae bacterium]
MNQVIDTILTTRLIGIIRMKLYEHPVEIMQALVEGGFKILEYTLSGQGALQAISAARAASPDQVNIGAGTVLSPSAVADAFSAGASFIVTPVVNLKVIDACQKYELPILCGAFTPTEIMLAVESGAELVKLFPARLGGPQYVRDLLAPFPDLHLVPTGGISAENAGDYLKAGAAAVAIGGNLLPLELVIKQQYSEISTRARACVQAVNQFQGNIPSRP